MQFLGNVAKSFFASFPNCAPFSQLVWQFPSGSSSRKRERERELERCKTVIAGKGAFASDLLPTGSKGRERGGGVAIKES